MEQAALLVKPEGPPELADSGWEVVSSFQQWGGALIFGRAAPPEDRDAERSRAFEANINAEGRVTDFIASCQRQLDGQISMTTWLRLLRRSCAL